MRLFLRHQKTGLNLEIHVVDAGDGESCLAVPSFTQEGLDAQEFIGFDYLTTDDAQDMNCDIVVKP